MNNLFPSLVASAGLLVAVSASALPDRVGDFALLDTEGEFHQLSRNRHQEALVLMAFDGSCAALDAELARLRQFAGQWAENGVGVALINTAGADLATARAALATRDIDAPLLLDKGQLVSETLQLERVGEVVVLDPQRLTVLYRGALSGADDVVQAELAGGVDTTTMAAGSGCTIDYPGRDAQLADVPDYTTEVAPILVEECASCHREGGIGPFALDSHLMLQGWSPMIREVLLTRRMPPMQVDPDIGHFDNANDLSAADMQTLVHWIDAGAPRGAGATDPLAAVEHVDMKSWRLGEPDYIVKAPRHEVPATGVLDYINVNVPLPFEEDTWVKAVQYIPGDGAVLHHLLTYVTEPAGTFEGGEADLRPRAQRFLEGYAPGKVDPITFPAGTGVKIPAGHQLSMQFHY
ncbi:MAG: redoxin domain-containing protein, partial [Pseudohongiellaceae bacterium]